MRPRSRYNESEDRYVPVPEGERQTYKHRTPDEAIAEGRRRAEATVREYVRQDAEIDGEEIAAWMDNFGLVVDIWPSSGEEGWMSEVAVMAAELLEYHRMNEDYDYLASVEAKFEAERGTEGDEDDE